MYEIKIKKYLPITLKVDNFFLNQYQNQIKTVLKNTAFIREFTKEIGFKIMALDPKFNAKL